MPLGYGGATGRGGLTGWCRSWRWHSADEVVIVDAADTDWAVAVADNPAAATDDTNDAAVSVLLFDGTNESGFGIRSYVPGGTTALRISVLVRAETAAAGDVQLQVYGRAVTAAVPAWSSAVTMDVVTVAATEQWVFSTSTLDIDDLDLVAGRPCLLEVTRNPGAAGDTLTGDAAIAGVGLEWL